MINRFSSHFRKYCGAEFYPVSNGTYEPSQANVRTDEVDCDNSYAVILGLDAVLGVLVEEAWLDHFVLRFPILRHDVVFDLLHSLCERCDQEGSRQLSWLIKVWRPVGLSSIESYLTARCVSERGLLFYSDQQYLTKINEKTSKS